MEAAIWKRLDDLYIVKCLPNKMYLLKNFFVFKMNTSKIMQEKLDVFNKLQLDLNNTGKKFDDEDVAVILLNSLPESFDDVKTAIKYGRDILTSSIVINAIKSRDFENRIKKDKLGSTNGEGLFVRSISSNKNYNNNGNKGYYKARGKSKGRSQSKSRYNNGNNHNRNGNGRRAFYYYEKYGH